MLLNPLTQLTVASWKEYLRFGYDSVAIPKAYTSRWSLSVMFIVAVHVLWCRYLHAFGGVRPQLYANSLKCVSSDSDLPCGAAKFTAGYVRLVGRSLHLVSVSCFVPLKK